MGDYDVSVRLQVSRVGENHVQTSSLHQYYSQVILIIHFSRWINPPKIYV